MFIHPSSLVYTPDGCVTREHAEQPNGLQLVGIDTKPVPVTDICLTQGPQEYLEVSSRYGTFYLDPDGYVAVMEDVTKLSLKKCRELTALDILVSIPHPPKRPYTDGWRGWWLRGLVWAAKESTIVTQHVTTPYKTLITEALYELRFFTATYETTKFLKWFLNTRLDTTAEELYQLDQYQLRAFLAGARVGSMWQPDPNVYQMALSAPLEKLIIAQKLYLRLGIHTSIRYGVNASLNEPPRISKKMKTWLLIDSQMSQELWLALIATFMAEDPFLPSKASRMSHCIPQSMLANHGNLIRGMAKPPEKNLDWERVIHTYMVFLQWIPLPLKDLKKVTVPPKTKVIKIHAPQPFLMDSIVVASEDNLPQLPRPTRVHAQLSL